MKNMKKLLVVTLAVLFTFSITGCGNKTTKSSLTPKQAFEKSKTESEKIENYKIVTNATIGMDMSALLPEGTKESGVMEATATVDAKLDIKNKKAYMKTSVVSAGIAGGESTEMYMDFADQSNAIMYVKESDTWKKVVAAVADSLNTVDQIQNIGENYELKELAADKDNYNYEVNIKPEDLTKMLSSLSSSTDSAESFEAIAKSVSENIKMVISLDKETYNVTKIKMDLIDLLKNIDAGYGIKYTKANFEFIISDYNKVGDVIIPEDVINNAKEEQDNEETTTENETTENETTETTDTTNTEE